MTLDQFIAELKEIAAEIGGDAEVISVDTKTGETFSPVVSAMYGEDGKRRVLI